MAYIQEQNKYGNNGVGTESQKQANETQLANDPTYVQREYQRTQEVIGNRTQAGMDVSQQNIYLNRLNDYAKKHGITLGETQPVTQPIQQSGEYQAILDSIESSKNAQIEQSRALIQQQIQQQIAELQRNLDQAVTEGKISVRDAEAQFELQSKIINQQAYEQSQLTNLQGENRGIQNSQQFLGLMAGDNARKNSLINENITTRDRRINDIRDRINNLKNQTNRDIMNAITSGNLEMSRAEAQINQQASDQMLGLRMSDYQARQAQEFALQQMRQQQNYNLQNMGIQQSYVESNMNRQHNNQLELMKISNKNDIEKMRIGHSLDMNKMKEAFKNDLELLLKQHENSKDLIALREESSIRELERQRELSLEQAEKEYELARERELAKYTWGTPEYKIREAQMEDAFNQRISDIHAESVYQAVAQIVASDPDLESSDQKKRAEAYQRYLNFLGGRTDWNNPLGPNPYATYGQSGLTPSNDSSGKSAVETLGEKVKNYNPHEQLLGPF